MSEKFSEGRGEKGEEDVFSSKRFPSALKGPWRLAGGALLVTASGVALGFFFQFLLYKGGFDNLWSRGFFLLAFTMIGSALGSWAVASFLSSRLLKMSSSKGAWLLFYLPFLLLLEYPLIASHTNENLALPLFCLALGLGPLLVFILAMRRKASLGPFFLTLLALIITFFLLAVPFLKIHGRTLHSEVAKRFVHFKIGHEMKKVLYSPAFSELAWELKLPEEAMVDVSLGLPPSLSPRAMVFNFYLESQGQKEGLIHHAIYEPELRRPGLWEDLRLDMSAYGGKQISLYLKVKEKSLSGRGTVKDRLEAMALWLHPYLYHALLSSRHGPLTPQSAFVTEPVVFSAVEKDEALKVILISIDTLRADHLGCYGYKRDTSPNIDALAKRSSLFPNSISQASWTLPSHVSLLTSLEPLIHGALDERKRLNSSYATLPYYLDNSGYHTRAYVTNLLVSQRYGFEKGFDYFSFKQNLSCKRLTDEVIEWLEANGDKRFFLFLHYFDPHWGYAPPPPFDSIFGKKVSAAPFLEVSEEEQTLVFIDKGKTALTKEHLEAAISLYDGEIRYLDEQLGNLFHAITTLGLEEDILIILTSDHGEEFFEHGGMGHSHSLYDEQIKVPLILFSPRLFPRAQVIEEQVRLIDIMPTILELVGLEIPESLQGKSLLPLLKGGEDPSWPALAISHSSRYAGLDILSLRTPRYKFISTQGTAVKEELYDLREDPGEQRNLVHKRTEEAEVFRKQVVAYRERTRQGTTPVANEVALSQEEEELLKSLGYLN